MRFIDKALEIELQKVNGDKEKLKDKTDIIQNSCPWEYGFDENYECVGKYGCSKCWNREHPELSE